ncbi:MAG: NAD-dependent epimerase/dehydratase family protein [Pseudomonadota bacterium]
MAEMMDLVTGGAGFIGTHLVRLLRERGDQVRVLDLRAPTEPVPEVEYLQGSITDGEAVHSAVRGCRRVFHMAAHAGLWARDKQAFTSVNVAGTRNVLEAARAAGAETVVHTSTESILIATGRGRKPQRISEQTTLSEARMAGPYCVGKLRAEQEACDAWRTHGQRVIICNPTVPVGPGDHWLTPPSRMMLGFLNRRLPAYMPTTLNLVDARDVAMGHLLAAERGAPGNRYILGAHDVELAELLQRLQFLSGVAMPTRRVPYRLAWLVALGSEWLADHVTRRPPAAPLTGVRLGGIPVRFDNRRTRDALGWRPRPLDESLQAAIGDYRERGLIEPDTPAAPRQPKRMR